MRTKRIKLYEFSELNEASKEKVIDNLQNINVDYDWSGLTIEDMVKRLSELGFNDGEVLFSGFGSQGDGACFTCSSIDFYKFLDGQYKEFANVLSCSITHNGRYYFAASTTVNLEIEGNIGDEDYNEIEKSIETERERLGNIFYKELESEYEYLTSKEAIIETIEINKYEFFQDGALSNF